MNIRRFIVLSLVFSCCVLAGCATNRQGQQMAPEIYQSAFYVERQPKDERNLAANIAAILQSRGFNAYSGEQGQTPDSADYVISYIDKWYWDMRMYLLSLRIEVRERSANHIVAYGESFQTSLAAMGETHDDIINYALDEMIVRGRIIPPDTESKITGNSAGMAAGADKSMYKLEVSKVADAMECKEAISLKEVTSESESWHLDCGDGESIEVKCFDGTCYITP